MGLDFSSHHVMHRYFYLYFTPTTRKAGLCILSTVRVNITAAESYTGWFKKKVHFWGDNTDISEKNVCLILKGYRNRAFGGYRTNSVRFLFVGMGEERSLRKKGGYMRRIARPHFGCRCRQEESWTSTQTNSTRSSHWSCRMPWVWRWDFRPYVVNCKKFVI